MLQFSVGKEDVAELIIPRVAQVKHPRIPVFGRSPTLYLYTVLISSPVLHIMDSPSLVALSLSLSIYIYTYMIIYVYWKCVKQKIENRVMYYLMP